MEKIAADSRTGCESAVDRRIVDRWTSDTPFNVERPATSEQNSPFHDRHWLAMVRLLGPVDVVNREGRAVFGPATSMEFLAWLATHRGWTTRATAALALRGGQEVTSRWLTNMLSTSRRLLRGLAGDPPDGLDWIGVRQSPLRLHPLVVSDYDLLSERVASTSGWAAEERAAALADAIGLIRGHPFGGARWNWVDDEYLASTIAVDVVDAVCELVVHRLAAGDPRAALNSIGLGLRVIPSHERLTELSIEAWLRVGERRMARAVFEAYKRGASVRGDVVMPEIARLAERVT